MLCRCRQRSRFARQRVSARARRQSSLVTFLRIMGKGLLQKLRPQQPMKAKKTATVKVLTSKAFSAAIVEKQYQDTIKHINEFLANNRDKAVKVLHLIRTGVLDDEADDSALVPSSTNKFKLLSLGMLKQIAEALVSDRGTAELKARVAQLKTKSEFLKVTCFLANVCDTCAIPSRSLDRWISMLKGRLNDARLQRLSFVSAKGGRPRSASTTAAASSTSTSLTRRPPST